jgi:hypothetical protein
VSALLIGSAMFALAFAAHVVWWRLRKPRQQGTTLVALFSLVAAVAVGALLALGLDRFGLNLAQLVLTVDLFGSYALIYLILFSALEADSPTLTMIRLVQKRGPRGMSEDDLVRAMAGQSFVKRRVQQMIDERMAVRIGDRLYASRKGRWLAAPILFYRRLLKRGQPGG